MTPEQRRRAIEQREKHERQVSNVMKFATVVFTLAGLAMAWLAVYMSIFFARSCMGAGCDWASFGVVVAAGIMTGLCLVGVRLSL